MSCDGSHQSVVGSLVVTYCARTTINYTSGLLTSLPVMSPGLQSAMSTLSMRPPQTVPLSGVVEDSWMSLTQKLRTFRSRITSWHTAMLIRHGSTITLL